MRKIVEWTVPVRRAFRHRFWMDSDGMGSRHSFHDAEPGKDAIEAEWCAWCLTHVGSPHVTRARWALLGTYYIGFKYPEDALHFKMRFAQPR